MYYLEEVIGEPVKVRPGRRNGQRKSRANLAGLDEAQFCSIEE
jgi:hypothetical protein